MICQALLGSMAHAFQDTHLSAQQSDFVGVVAAKGKSDPGLTEADGTIVVDVARKFDRVGNMRL